MMATKTTAAKTTAAARVKGGNVERYYRLLVRVGMDKILSQASGTRRKPPSGRITSATEQLGTVETEADEPVGFDLGQLVLACAGADDTGDLTALAELAAAVLDLSDEAAAGGDWYMDDLESAWPGFSSACAAPTRMLLSYGTVSGS